MAVTKGKRVINFEVWPDEKERIKEAAAWYGMPVAAFVRWRVLGVYDLEREELEDMVVAA